MSCILAKSKPEKHKSKPKNSTKGTQTQNIQMWKLGHLVIWVPACDPIATVTQRDFSMV